MMNCPSLIKKRVRTGCIIPKYLATKWGLYGYNLVSKVVEKTGKMRRGQRMLD
jgi:hypothetical protein